jgi:hypothetical protein
MDELRTVVRLKLPLRLRRSLACINIIENMTVLASDATAA